MSRLDYAIKQWFKDHIAYILMTIIVLIIAFALYGQADRDIKTVQEKENRINNIEERLTKQEHYMHQVQADVDNLYRVVE
jgi:peptidoglycan hydrolase CwlO-like protein